MLRTFRELIKDTRANIIAITAVGAASLVGGSGLAVDAVYWYLWKRQLQQAVDSGALAGAYALAAGLEVTPAATLDITKNSNTTITVQKVSAPPTSGAYSGNTSAVEVIATTSRELPFSSMFLDAPPTIRSRAVAAFVSGGEHCVISLAKTGIGVSVAGTAKILLTCGVAANSVDIDAIDLDGGSWLTGSPLSSVGGIEYNADNIPSDTNLNPYGLPQIDPIASRNLAPPASPAACTENNFQVQPSTSATISPGRYCNGMSLKGNVTMNPGVYIIDKGEFHISSQASVLGEGVTIILTGDNANNMATARFQGGADVELRAPTQSENATWHSILIYQNQIGAKAMSELVGDSDFNLEGVVYMPNGSLKFAGSSGQHADCLLLVAYRLQMTGETSLATDCDIEYQDFDTSGRRMRIVE